MNQNNNIIAYDSQTGQPIYGNQNTSAQQPTQPQMNTGYTQQPTQPQSHKKSKKGLAIIAVLVIIIIAGIVLLLASLLALNLLSPATISNLLPTGRTTIGSIPPYLLIEAASSSNLGRSK